MAIEDGTACIIIDDKLKNIVPKEEVAKFVHRFRGQEECETAELQKLNNKPMDHGSVATYFAILKLKFASGVSHKAFYVYANGNCPIPDEDSPHLRYLFSLSTDEIHQNLSFLASPPTRWWDLESGWVLRRNREKMGQSGTRRPEKHGLALRILRLMVSEKKMASKKIRT